MRLKPGDQVYLGGGTLVEVEDVLGPRAIVVVVEQSNDVMRVGERYEVHVDTLHRGEPLQRVNLTGQVRRDHGRT